MEEENKDGRCLTMVKWYITVNLRSRDEILY